MLEERIAKRYAKALFELASENSVEKTTLEELIAISEAVRENHDLSQLFLENQYVATELLAAVKLIFSDKSELIQSFLGILIEKRRTNLLFEITELYRIFLEESEGVGMASITSAFALSDEEIEKIKVYLESKFNKKMRMEVAIDKALLAGVRVQYGDYVIDTSYQAKLQNLKQQIQSDELEVKGTDEH